MVAAEQFSKILMNNINLPNINQNLLLNIILIIINCIFIIFNIFIFGELVTKRIALNIQKKFL